MKAIKGILKLTFIWVLSVLAFAIGFTLFIMFQTNQSIIKDSPEMVMVGFLCIIWLVASFFFALLSSIPGFAFFAIFGSIVLSIPMSQNIKKGLLIAINCLNLFMHGFVGYHILKDSAFVPGAFNTVGKYIMWLPNWTLFIVSNATILLLNYNTHPKTNQ